MTFTQSINTKPTQTDLINLISPEVKPTEGQDNQDLLSTFGDALQSSLQKVNEAKQASANMTKAFTLGEDVPLHQVMITAEKASNAMEVTLQVRNKILQAYQEVMHMPI